MLDGYYRTVLRQAMAVARVAFALQTDAVRLIFILGIALPHPYAVGG